MKNKTVCFTGHREIKHNNIQGALCSVLENLILKGYIYYGAGGARGFDSIAAATVAELKKKYSQVKLILVLPFKDQYKQENNWTNEEIELYYDLLNKADKTVYIKEHYARGVYYERNRHLVNHSSVCICYQYKNSGGTFYTTEYAKKNGLNIINIANIIKKNP